MTSNKIILSVLLKKKNCFNRQLWSAANCRHKNQITKSSAECAIIVLVSITRQPHCRCVYGSLGLEMLLRCDILQAIEKFSSL